MNRNSNENKNKKANATTCPACHVCAAKYATTRKNTKASARTINPMLTEVLSPKSDSELRTKATRKDEID